jgi:2-amino-4-hydroxy-6-hydroxymethyldihydropteridine diphosphokinase
MGSRLSAALSKVIVALGSNFGDSMTHVESAMNQIEKLAVGAVTRSSFWSSEAKDMQDQSGAFINAAVSFQTDLDPLALLSALQQIEIDMGRPHDHERYVARIIDLDVIDVDGRQISEPTLLVPHPRMLERLFVLLPLRDVRPDYRDPEQQQSIDELIRLAPEMDITRR